MAGASHFIWISLFLSCIFQASDNIHVHQEVTTENSEVDRILSGIPITLPEGIDPKNVNVTSIIIKTCADMKEEFTLLNRKLQETTLHNRQLDEEAFGLRSEVRLLKLQLATCSSTASAVTGSYQTQLHNRLKQLLETFDSDTFLILRVIPLTREVKTLERKIKLAANSTETTTDITALQRELQEKINELHAKKQQIERSHTNSALILEIISLQNQIWDLEQEESRGGETSPLHNKRIIALQEQLVRKISELRGKGDADSAMLELISVHSKITATQRLISILIEKSRTDAVEYQRQFRQKGELLKKKILQLSREESNVQLTKEILILQAEVEHFRQLVLNARKITDSRLKELRVILEEEKKQQENLQKQLEETDYAQSQMIMKIISVMKEVRELQNNGQQQATTLEALLQAKEREYAKAQTEIEELQRKLRLKNEECSGLEERYANIKTEFEQKIAELNRTEDSKAALILSVINLHDELKTLRDLISTTEDPERKSELQRQLEEKQEKIKALETKLNETEVQCSNFEQKIKEPDYSSSSMKVAGVTSLALQVSTLTLQQDELKRQLQNTQSKAKITELQKLIDEKSKELANKTEELKARSTQPQRLLQIIALQTEIEKIVTVAVNDSDYTKIRALEDHLNYLVEGIQDEHNENIKLVFKVLTYQEEIARLKKQEKSQTKALLEKIKGLENELANVRNQIAEKTLVLDSSGMRITNLSAQIMELHSKIKPLEDEISYLKETNTENLEELQKRVSLTSKQLQDSELRLKDADAKNFNLIMEIADLRKQLKKAQRQSSRATAKNINELEQQLETQKRENRKLENTNRDLKQEVEELKMCCNDDRTHCEDLQRQLIQSQKDADRLQQQLQEKDAMLRQLQQDVEERTMQNNKLQEDYNHLQKKNEELSDAVQALQNQINDVEDKTIHTRKMTLDPDTANPRVVLSAGNTEMSTREEIQDVPDNPGRFDVALAALGNTGFSAGRHYWEVSVAGKLCYHVGMATESAPRKGTIRFNPTNGFWTIVLNKQGQYRAIDKLTG
ncbi:interaptin-like isoform X2 [Lates japonicus]|uniref:Interaptin-like isoform X2 n=1 Tax=Lates japonicus TaxID=270547 RepID=A0AAD3MCJ8_LATJO|nr:interaptin-like isoform X2 [Lates japonicus]